MQVPSVQGFEASALSIFIARVVKLSDDFKKSGILVVDIDDVDSKDVSGPLPDADGSSYMYATVSKTLLAAYLAWEKPPTIKYKGSLKGVGKIKLGAGGFTGNIGTCPVGGPILGLPKGVVLEDSAAGEIDISTDAFEIVLTSDVKSQLPWCKSISKEAFINPNDKVLLGSVGNSFDRLYVIELLI